VNKHTDRRAHAIAILSSDPWLAALIGSAVELIGFRAAFVRADETPIDGVRRMRPAFVLLDAADTHASDETFLGRALMTGARLFAFGREADVERHRSLAARYGMGLIVFPRDIDALPSILSRRVSPTGRHAHSLQQ